MEKLKQIYQSLNIDNITPENALFEECPKALLIDAGVDVFNREIKMHHKAYQQWLLMKSSAQQQGIDLQIVSAFRSYAYQAEIIKRKLKSGQALTDIIKVSALPGFSEHHTGCALDLTTSGESEVLTENFEKTQAFTWLMENAHQFSFILSYPKNNDKGFIYEPWHWCYQL
ncbi:M15 family metallopeptidase [Facilibium subflavum]|uniref:M15 family metallopeptidase n=1 Tax=Facilibium subflavum TaxID=2219058 RepID=UPI000E64D8E2|nr:M15 family metallopeptidase [Facilibium subflavum]